eukprot:gene188-71_t
MIKNPAYKGPWVHPEIDNPEYVTDDNIYAFDDFSFVGIDVWQVKACREDLEAAPRGTAEHRAAPGVAARREAGSAERFKPTEQATGIVMSANENPRSIDIASRARLAWQKRQPTCACIVCPEHIKKKEEEQKAKDEEERKKKEAEDKEKSKEDDDDDLDKEDGGDDDL